ncbi:hypothetical protein DY000_02010974 [Brassica cretica]|uniref:NET domain-containing protein n=1 Tax=Brassica cretica TaxID=69181 RepID=A0ABQ7CPU8_BRACR|nr:hypothetical protein DY000_02010974 [Brassica cretica]
MIEEILADAPLEVALIQAKSEQNTCNVDADGYEKMLDLSKSIEKMVAFLRRIEEILADDPVEVALIRAESEQNTCNVDADGYEKMLDLSKNIEKMVAFLKSLKG